MTHNPVPWDAISDDEDDADAREQWMWGGKKAFIFLIDATEGMFERNIDKPPFFTICVEACKNIMLQKVFDQEKDLFGIVLYGTKHVGKTSQPNHVTTLQNLELINADKIKELLNILAGNYFLVDQAIVIVKDLKELHLGILDVDEFEKNHGHSDNFSLAEALWHCSKLVSNCNTKVYEKTIFLMTCNDNPHSSDPKLQHYARTRANDLNQMDIKIEILPLGLSFNMKNFYEEVYQIMHAQDLNTSYYKEFKIIKEVDDIVNCVRQSPNKRSISRVLWSLGEGVKLGVAAYKFVKSAPPYPKKIKLERSKNNLVTSRVQIFKAETGEEVSAAEVSKAVIMGGQTVTFETEELQKLKQLTKPGLVLLGFKPADTMKLWFYRKEPVFLYPEERIVKGSRTLFAALHERCIARKMIAICYFTPRRSAKPALVALFPQQEKCGEDDSQLMPPGFLLCYLPYADNIRELKDQEVECPHPESDLVTVAQKIIKKVKINYEPSLISNPKLQKHWSGIEALALGYSDPKEVEDYTIPNYERMDERLDQLAVDFMQMAFPDGFDEAMIKKSVKRNAPAARNPPPKKVKPDLDNMNMEDIAKQGLVEKLTVDKLKQYLAAEDIRGSSKMKKVDLVAAVYNHLDVSQP